MTDHERDKEAAYRRGYFQGYLQGIDDISVRRRTHAEANAHLFGEILNWRFDATSCEKAERTPPPVMADNNDNEGKASK